MFRSHLWVNLCNQRGVVMSVLACDRNGCQNIMCDRFSYEFGYICNECFVELYNLDPPVDIQRFMLSKKGKEIDVNFRKEYIEMIENEFRIRN